MDDDDKFSMRDKFAIEIFSGLMVNETYIVKDSINSFINDEIKPLQKDNYRTRQIIKLMRKSYQLADLFREIRLVSFE